jgi:hypothetical protein
MSPGEMTGGYGGLVITLAAALALFLAAMYVGFPLLLDLFFVAV